MGNILKVIYDVIDDIDSSYFYSNGKLTEEQKYLQYITQFRDASDFKEYELIKYEDVIDGSNENYVYFICCIQQLNELLIKSPKQLFNSKIEGLLRNHKNFKLVLLNYGELEDENTFITLNNYITNLNIDGFKIFLCNQNLDIVDYIKKYNSKINFFLPIRSYKDALNNFVNNKIEFKEEKEYLFMTYNRSMRPHRYALLCLLMKNKLLDYTDWSLLTGWNMSKHIDRYGENYGQEFYNNVLEDEDRVDLQNEISYFNSIDMKKSKYENSVSLGDIGDDFPNCDFYEGYVQNPYDNSYINITTESSFERNITHITEKSFKPFYFNQIPIFVAGCGHIEKLKNKFHFDFFDDFVDHSYDVEVNPKKRLKLIVSEIQRIKDEKESLVKYYISNKDRFLKNQKMIKELANDVSDYNFFKNLIN